MANDAGAVLGSPQLAGVKVNPRGMAKSKSMGMSGMYAASSARPQAQRPGCGPRRSRRRWRRSR